MDNKLIKRIALGLLIPLILLTLGWAKWITTQAFSAQKTEVVLREHKIEASTERSYVRGQFKGLNIKIDNLNDKIDKNQTNNNKILLDIQKQISK